MAANAFLDAYAATARRSGVRTVAVNWGIWNQVGMAAESFESGGAEEAEGGALEGRYPVGSALAHSQLATALELAGRDIYQREGCYTCHLQTDAPTMHTTPAVRLGCTDCHGGNATVRGNSDLPQDQPVGAAGADRSFALGLALIAVHMALVARR